MTSDDLSVEFDSSFVDTSVEAGWQRLETQVELSAGFWLGFIFSAASRDVDTLRRDTEGLLLDHGRTFYHRKLVSPDEFLDLLAWLLTAPEAARAGCVLIESIISDSPGARETPFAQAWGEFFLRANQKRDLLRKTLCGGLVFAAPPAIKPLVRDAAPDLWSVRSLVIDVTSSASSVHETTYVGPPIRTPPPPPNMPISVDLNWDHGRERTPPPTRPRPNPPTGPGAPRSDRIPLETRIRNDHVMFQERFLFTSGDYDAVDALLAAGRLDEAETRTRSILELIGDNAVFDVAFVRHLSSRVHEAKGRHALALSEMEAAIDAYDRAAPDYVPIDWYMRAGHLATQNGQHEGAGHWLERAVKECRKRVQKHETVDELRHLVAALLAHGDWKSERRQGDAATLLYYEAIRVARRLVDLRGEDVESLYSLLTSLLRFGDACRDKNDLSNAMAAFEESIVLADKLCRLDDESRWSLIQVSIALNRVGGLQQCTEDWESARKSYRKSLDYRRRLVAMRGDRQSIQWLISVLEKLARVEGQLGNDEVAVKLMKESVLFKQRIGI